MNVHQTFRPEVPPPGGLARPCTGGLAHPSRRVLRTLALSAACLVAPLLGALPSAAHAAATGTVVAWGDNRHGQTSVPSGLNGVSAVAAGGFHTFALSDGTVVAWGASFFQAPSSPLTGVSAIAVSDNHALALKSGGTVVVWGYNDYGQAAVPPGLSDVIAIAAGLEHSVALANDGKVVAWGDNTYGQTIVPTGLSGVIAIAAGDHHTVALTKEGTVVAWGDNASGQTIVPTGLSGVIAIAAGALHTVALKSDGTVIAWGHNFDGQTSVPQGLRDVMAVACGAVHTVALKRDGTVVAWGRNHQGQTSVPPGLSGAMAIAAGAFHTVALKSDYRFGGFLAPLDPQPTTFNRVKAGSAVPVKFSLGGDKGLAIFASGYPAFQPIACNSSAFYDDVETTVPASSNSLNYDASSDTYTYVWKTSKAWTGCGQLILRLADGIDRMANFRFDK